MTKKNRISVITLGCSKNTVDSERLVGQLRLNNFKITQNSNSADSVIINTCGFIDAAKEESINTILEAVELKKRGKLNKVFVVGCLSQRYKDELQKEISEVDKYFGTEAYEEIIKEIGGEYKYDLLGERELSTPKHYAYLKISEGCDNPCSFCAIPLMRGKHKTKLISDLIKESEALVNKGVKELILIGQDTTDYGHDQNGKRSLSYFLKTLCAIEGIEWIRLLYAYPSHFPKDVMQVIAENPKLCRYIDLPLQHISDKVLKSMRRGITKRRTIELINELRAKIPGLTLRTTFIVGYPAETEREFEELCDFVKETKFDRFGVFTYSIEENTPAFILGDSVTPEEKEERKARLMEIQQEISLEKNRSFIGKKLKVIIDGIEGDYYIARSERDAPEVDGEVLIPIKNSTLNKGTFYNVDIYDCNDYDLFGFISQ
ncbi:MAG: 30S ribosomal protein S12 methylthiotransferase RimO [bacterium]